MAGTFITFEGGEGSGKSTQSQLLADHLTSAGRTVLRLREPGATPLGESLRELLLHRRTGMSPEAELLLFLAARAELVRSVIRPALDAGTVVICDRFSDSTFAYQGYGRGLELGRLRTLNDWATGGLVPDLTVLLDVPVEVGLRRKHGETDAFQLETVEFHERVRQGYLSLATSEPSRWLVADGTMPVAEIAARITEAVTTLIRSD
jgi:dTMP kinase